MKTVNLSLSTCRVPDNDGIIGLQVIRMMNLPKRSTNFCHFSYRAYVYCFIIALQNVRCVTDWICLHSYSAVLIFFRKKGPVSRHQRAQKQPRAKGNSTHHFAVRHSRRRLGAQVQSMLDVNCCLFFHIKMQLSYTENFIYHHWRMRRGNVLGRVRVCFCVSVWTLTFESLDQKLHFWQYVFSISGSCSYIKVIGSRPRSHGQKCRVSCSGCNFQIFQPFNFIFGMQIHLQNIQVKVEAQGHEIKVIRA